MGSHDTWFTRQVAEASKAMILFLQNIQKLHEPSHEKTNNLHSENKGADQLCSNCTADQRLCFHYMNSTIPLCLTWSELPKTGFVSSWLKYSTAKLLINRKLTWNCRQR